MIFSFKRCYLCMQSSLIEFVDCQKSSFTNMFFSILTLCFVQCLSLAHDIMNMVPEQERKAKKSYSILLPGGGFGRNARRDMSILSLGGGLGRVARRDSSMNREDFQDYDNLMKALQERVIYYRSLRNTLNDSQQPIDGSDIDIAAEKVLRERTNPFREISEEEVNQ